MSEGLSLFYAFTRNYDCLQEEKGVIQFYNEIYVPDDEDNLVKEYIRMRDDQKLMLKKIKQQILAFVLRQGKNE